MDYEKQYIDYLIENIQNIDSGILDDYFLDRIDFSSVIESIDVTKYDVMSYNTFLKDKKIDNLFD